MSRRVLRILLLTILGFTLRELASTTPYLGLPFEPKPKFLDCYLSMRWVPEARSFSPTGLGVVCLGESK